ncbi:hypothetical protein LguiA_011804 [Lonicera macranthoides]
MEFLVHLIGEDKKKFIKKYLFLQIGTSPMHDKPKLGKIKNCNPIMCPYDHGK